MHTVRSLEQGSGAFFEARIGDLKIPAGLFEQAQLANLSTVSADRKLFQSSAHGTQRSGYQSGQQSKATARRVSKS